MRIRQIKLQYGYANRGRCRIREWSFAASSALDLEEHERVIVTVVKAAARLDGSHLEQSNGEPRHTEDVPDLAEVRTRLAKIPGSMADEIIAQRGDS